MLNAPDSLPVAAYLVATDPDIEFYRPQYWPLQARSLPERLARHFSSGR